MPRNNQNSQKKTLPPITNRSGPSPELQKWLKEREALKRRQAAANKNRSQLPQNSSRQQTSSRQQGAANQNRLQPPQSVRKSKSDSNINRRTAQNQQGTGTFTQETFNFLNNTVNTIGTTAQTLLNSNIEVTTPVGVRFTYTANKKR